MTERWLLIITITGHVLKLGAAALLANALGPEHYDEYAVAVSSLVLLSTIAELGLGKLGLGLIPTFLAERDDRRAAFFSRSSLLLVLGTSLFLSSIILIFEDFEFDAKFARLSPSLEVALFLTPAALTGVGVELATARSFPLFGAFIARIVVPSLPLLAGLAHFTGVVQLDPEHALLAYGGGWLLGFVLVFPRSYWARFETELPTMAAPPDRSLIWPWVAKGLGLMSFAVVLGLLHEGSLILVELVVDSDTEVSNFALSLEFGLFLISTVKSLDKRYIPLVSEALARHEKREYSKLVDARNRLVIRLTVAFFCLLVPLAPLLFDRLGSGFRGHEATLLIMGASASLLTFAGLSQWTLALLAGAAIPRKIAGASVLLMTSILLLLGGDYGALGAAIAFSIASGFYAVLIHRFLRRQLTAL